MEGYIIVIRTMHQLIKAIGNTCPTLLSGLRYRTYAGDEIAIITTAPFHVTEITQKS